MYNATYQIVIIRVVFLSIETVLGATYLESLNGKCQVFTKKGITDLNTRKNKSPGINSHSLATSLSGHAQINLGQKLISTCIKLSALSRLSLRLNKNLLVHAFFIIFDSFLALFLFPTAFKVRITWIFF